MLLALHIPNHTLSPAVIGVTFAAAALVAILAIERRFGGRAICGAAPFAAVAGLVFALQMFNFPLIAGTSGHVLGAALAAILLGPWYGGLALVLVLAVQCFALGDGGTTALGANIVNMAVVGCATSAVVYRFALGRRDDAASRAGAAFAAGWVGSIAASIACAVELALSGAASFANLAASLIGHYALLGIVEGMATAAALHAIYQPSALTGRLRLLPVATMLIAVAALVPWSSSLPDGLQAALAACAK